MTYLWQEERGHFDKTSTSSVWQLNDREVRMYFLRRT